MLLLHHKECINEASEGLTEVLNTEVWRQENVCANEAFGKTVPLLCKYVSASQREAIWFSEKCSNLLWSYTYHNCLYVKHRHVPYSLANHAEENSSVKDILHKLNYNYGNFWRIHATYWNLLSNDRSVVSCKHHFHHLTSICMNQICEKKHNFLSEAKYM